MKNIHNRKDFFYIDTFLRCYLTPLNYVKTLAMESFRPWIDYDLMDFVSTLPFKYRLSKGLYRETVTGMFPELFKEVSQTRNDIDWGAAFRSSPEVQRFAYRELIEEQNVFSEFMDIDGLKSELDTFFSFDPSESSGPDPLRARVKATAAGLVEMSPVAFNLAHKSLYYAQKWLGKPRDPFPPERVFLQLLILKVWGDVFLNHPVFRTSDASLFPQAQG